MKDKTVFWLSFYAAMLFLFAVGTISYGIFIAPLQVKSDLSQETAGVSQSPADINILACAREDDRSLPDHFALICISPQRGQIAVTNLPDDLVIDFGSRCDSPTQCYAYAGILQVVSGLKDKNIDIDHYIDITLPHLQTVVDTLGPFLFTVPTPVYSYDERGLLQFKQPAGEGLLGGIQVCGVLKYSDLSGQNYTALWLDMLHKALQTYFTAENISELPSIYKALCDGLSTDISILDIDAIQKNMTALMAVTQVSFVCPQNYSVDDFYFTLEDYF